MDGLALLCNLYADGPVTLRRLRAAEVRSLQALELVPVATLARWVHASLPQTHALLEEARRLSPRLAEEGPAEDEPRRRERDAALRERGARERVSSGSELQPQPLPLRSGLIAGLDDALAARLLEHGVRTFQALIEFTSLTLARRTGIPYSTLLELSRRARNHVALRSSSHSTSPAPFQRTPLRSERAAGEEPRPAVATAERRARAATRGASEEHPADGFTLPPEQPGSPGPFG